MSFQEDLVRLMNERRAEEEERNKLSDEDRAELERIETQKRMIEENRRMMAEAYANQIHDREVAALTRDLSLEDPEPADEELVVNRYEVSGTSEVRPI